jgi:diguanylate cyclase (GGDEF)-like protein
MATILLAEDSRFLRKATQLILSKAGYCVVAAADGEEALRLALVSQPQLILLDLMMPRMNGVEVIRALKQDPKTAHIPVLVLSVFSQQNEQKLLKAGAAAYYEKTRLVPESLLEIVRKTLENPNSAIQSVNGPANESPEDEARETLVVSKGDKGEYERQVFEQLIAVNNELLAAQRELAAVNEELRRISSTDELTGLANRRKGTEDINRLLSLARRQKATLCIALLDVDNFKNINDRFGHGAGDCVLRGLASLMLRHFRSEDVVGRWGGEEFIVALYGCSLQQAAARLEVIRKDLYEQRFCFGEAYTRGVSFSAGIVAHPQSGGDLERLIHAADTSLYAAKRGGRNRIIAEPSSNGVALQDPAQVALYSRLTQARANS